MSYFEAYGALDALNWRNEVAVRVGDFLARKVAPVGEKVDAMLRSAGGALSMSRVKARLEVLKAYLLRSRSAAAGDTSPELAALFGRIERHGEGRTIEAYSSYLFTVDTRI